MLRNTVALLYVGGLLAWDDAVVLPCDHPASPCAQPAPAIVVPPIRRLGIGSVKPDLEEASPIHPRQPESVGNGEEPRPNRPAPASGGLRRQN
jgi:hypothetical protein